MKVEADGEGAARTAREDDPAAPSLRRQFNDCCRPLFAADAAPGEQLAAVYRLFDLLSAIAGYDDAAPTEAENRDSDLPGGRAVAFQVAARCLWEFARTCKFLQGVDKALRMAQVRFPGRRLRLLEAGCGPFALLALPLATRFGADQVGFTLLDIHDRSLAAARSIVAGLGLEAYIDGYVRADAATWRCPEEARPHLVVSETMQGGLKNEPQVAITRNLAPQRVAGGLFLPEAVSLDFAMLTSRRGEDGVPHQAIRRLFPLYELSPDRTEEEAAGRFTLPAGLPADARPAVATHIRVYGDVTLGDNECSLTLPLRRKELADWAPGDVVEYAYRAGPRPGMSLSLAMPG